MHLPRENGGCKNPVVVVLDAVIMVEVPQIGTAHGHLHICSVDAMQVKVHGCVVETLVVAAVMHE